MPLDQVTIFGTTSADALPTRHSTGDGATPLRLGEHGELMTLPGMPWRQSLADEGSYYLLTDATLDVATTISGHAAPVLADIDATMTKALVWLANIDGSTSTKRIYIDFVEITVKTAGANGTSSLWAAAIDLSTRYTSGGTALTISSPTAGVTPTLTSASLTALGGAVVVPVETASHRRLGHGVIRPVIEVAADVLTFQCAEPFAAGRQVAAPTGRATTIPLGPVVLPPGYAFMIGLAGVAQDTAGVYGIRAGVWYR